MYQAKSKKHLWGRLRSAAVILGGAALVSCAPTLLHGQAAGWEGETGVFVTPLAYTATVEGQKIHPVVAYHYFDAGPIIGQFHEVSTEAGLGKRAEIGYNREFHVLGGSGGVYVNGVSAANLNYLWQNGMDIFNGKLNLVPENYQKHNWVPAISAGFIARTGDRNVGDYLTYNNQTNNGKNNGDIYLVASKVVTQWVKKMPIVLNAGVRGTNAELWGMGGNAPDWEAKPFGAAAFVFTGPAKSTIIFGAEAAAQPHHPLGYTSFTDIGGLPLNIPTTLTYCTRIVPMSKYHLNVDFGVAQIAGRIYNSGAGTVVDLKARQSWGSQITWGF
ncbi:MAG TPA: DUF3034 family protein [Terracidiphilus sp.]|nr:DUF3034 family protein [Terracidiphilus sp.]